MGNVGITSVYVNLGAIVKPSDVVWEINKMRYQKPLDECCRNNKLNYLTILYMDWLIN